MGGGQQADILGEGGKTVDIISLLMGVGVVFFLIFILAVIASKK
ncbi:hypothetical protein [Alteribacillus persepolensis]|nr:hypothetical protein [Alteribacillus persepolensis]